MGFSASASASRTPELNPLRLLVGMTRARSVQIYGWKHTPQLPGPLTPVLAGPTLVLGGNYSGESHKHRRLASQNNVPAPWQRPTNGPLAFRRCWTNKRVPFGVRGGRPTSN